MFWLSRFWRKKQFKIQTFTYYIPAPPARKTGYREKEFDKIFYEFINQGFEILNVQTQTHTGANSCGMWVIFAVRATNEKAEKLDLDELSQSLQDEISHAGHSSEDKEVKTLDLPNLSTEEEQNQLDQLYYVDHETQSEKS